MLETLRSWGFKILVVTRLGAHNRIVVVGFEMTRYLEASAPRWLKVPFYALSAWCAFVAVWWGLYAAAWPITHDWIGTSAGIFLGSLFFFAALSTVLLTRLVVRRMRAKPVRDILLFGVVLVMALWVFTAVQSYLLADPHRGNVNPTTLHGDPIRDDSAQQSGILPGLGIGDLRLGMTGAEVHSLMGSAEQQYGRSDLRWPSRGLGVTLTSGAIPRVARISGGDINPKHNARNLSEKTCEGLGLGSTESDIISVYGQPERTSDAEPGFRFLTYLKLGIDFKTLDGIVTYFTISAPVGKTQR
jgi:hypothetical protein